MKVLLNDVFLTHIGECRKHIETMIDCYYSMFRTKPKINYSSTLEKGDHPELDTSECLDSDSVQQHSWERDAGSCLC